MVLVIFTLNGFAFHENITYDEYVVSSLNYGVYLELPSPATTTYFFLF
jgi:hypothetical protein